MGQEEGGGDPWSPSRDWTHMYVHMKDMTVKSVCCCLKLLTHKFPIISHFHTFLARKRIVWGGGEEKGKKNPQFALHNDTRYPANKNTNPEMDLALFPHFSKYKVWIAAPSSHSESCSWSWGWTQQRDDCLSWYLKTVTWTGASLQPATGWAALSGLKHVGRWQ